MKILIFISLLFYFTNSKFIGIDIGTKCSKTTYFDLNSVEVVENDDNRRKDPTLIGIEPKHRRVFGNKAQKMMKTTPERVFQYANKLFGKSYDDPMVQYIKTFSSNDIQPMNVSKSLTIPVFHLENLTLTMEDVMINMMRRELINAQRQSKETINTCMLSIPPFSTPIERYSMVHSAKMVGLHVKQLINSPMAFMSTYATKRDISHIPTNILVIDIGDISIEMGAFTVGSKNNQNSIGTVKSLGYYSSQFFGGHSFDAIVIDLLTEKVKSELSEEMWNQLEKTITLNIQRKAEKIKKVLSVNKESTSVIELGDDKQINITLTLDEFEKRCDNEMKKFKEILQDAMKQMKIKPSQISMVQLVGGGMRIPMILNALEKYFGESKIHRNIDAEEGAATGIGYNYNLQFSFNFIKKVYEFSDTVPMTWYLTIPLTQKQKEKTLFTPQSILGTNTTITFDSLSLNELNKFKFSLHYQMEQNDKQENKKIHFMYVSLKKETIEKIQETMKKSKVKENGQVKIKITFELNQLGLIEMKEFIVNKQQIEKVKYDISYHSYISMLSKRKSESKNLLKYFSQNEDAYSKLISTSVSFESIIDGLKMELEDKKDFPEREKYLEMIQKDKEWLEMTDLDTLTRKDFVTHLNQYTKLSYQLHPEFKDKIKKMKQEKKKKNMEQQYQNTMNLFAKFTKRYNFIQHQYSIVENELTQRTDYPDHKNVLNELKFMKNALALDHFKEDVKDFKQVMDYKGVSNFEKEIEQYDKYFSFFEELHSSLLKKENKVEL